MNGGNRGKSAAAPSSIELVDDDYAGIRYASNTTGSYNNYPQYAPIQQEPSYYQQQTAQTQTQQQQSRPIINHIVQQPPATRPEPIRYQQINHVVSTQQQQINHIASQPKAAQAQQQAETNTENDYYLYDDDGQAVYEDAG